MLDGTVPRVRYTASKALQKYDLRAGYALDFRQRDLYPANYRQQRLKCFFRFIVLHFFCIEAIQPKGADCTFRGIHLLNFLSLIRIIDE